MDKNIISVMIDKKLVKKALKEASEWDKHATEYEKSEIPHYEAKKRVLKRIFNKYFDEKM